MPVTIVEYPTKLPAKCLNCGSPYSQDGRRFLDLHIDVLRYGRLYLCTLCFAEAAGLVGYVSEEAVSDLKEITTQRAEHITVLESENGILRRALTELNLLRSSDLADASAESREEFTAVNSTERNEESAVHPSTGKRNTKNAKPGSPEPSNGGGSFNIPALVEAER